MATVFAGEKNPEFSAGPGDGGYTLAMVQVCPGSYVEGVFPLPGPALLTVLERASGGSKGKGVPYSRASLPGFGSQLHHVPAGSFILLCFSTFPCKMDPKIVHRIKC